MKVITKPLNPFTATREKYRLHGLKIKHAEGNDFERVINLIFKISGKPKSDFSSWLKEHNWDLKDKFYGHPEQDHGRRVYYSIEDRQGNLVGSAGLLQYDPELNPRAGELVNLQLLPVYSGKGLEEAVVEDLVKKSRMVAMDLLFVETQNQPKSLINACKKVGFAVVANPSGVPYLRFKF